MVRIKPRNSRAKHFTSPPELSEFQGQAETLHRCGVLYAKAFAQELGITIPTSIIRKSRTLHNRIDQGPDPRGRHRTFQRSDTSAISDYLDDSTISLDDKGEPWLSIAKAAGIELPQTVHLKPPDIRTVEVQTLQRTCKGDGNLISTVCEKEKELTPEQAKAGCEFVDEQLGTETTPDLRPHAINWKKVAFYDEFHFGMGPQTTKRIKRKRGSYYRYKPENVHRKKLRLKDTKAKAREDERLKLFNVFVIIGYNYRNFIFYRVPNNIGKITTKVYTENILAQLLEDFREQGMTLYQDADSAHTSKSIIL